MNSVATFLHEPSKSHVSSNSSEDTGLDSSFTDRVWRLLDRIDCRLVQSDDEREEIFRLRYNAYLREGSIAPNSSESFSDQYDKLGRVYLLGVYIDGEIASSIRIHVLSKEHPYGLSLEAFSDILQPELDAGKVIVDPTRFVTDERLARLHRALPYITTRLCGMAARFFSADYLLAAVRVEHQAFYRRVFTHRVICAPRSYPGLIKPLSLMTIHYPTVSEEVHRRFPFFRSTYSERRMLFEGARNFRPSAQDSLQRRANLAPRAQLEAASAAP
jgi:N-acyl-L-homoserine lactone synthetase